MEDDPGKALRLWDAAIEKLLAVLHGHTNGELQVAFRPDGTGLVSGSGDHTVRIWDSLSAQKRAKHLLGGAP